MRSRIIALLCAAMIAAILPACQSRIKAVKPQGLEEIPPQVDQIEVETGDSLYDPQTLGEVEDLADYIVKGKLLDDAKQKLQKDNKNNVIYGVTISSFQISQVYRGNLKAGDEISLAEKYYTAEKNGKSVRHEFGYGPSVPNREYVFFLIKAQDDNKFLHGCYCPMVKETGRYPVIDTGKKNTISTNSLAGSGINLVLTDPDVYQSIYQDVIDKYMK